MMPPTPRRQPEQTEPQLGPAAVTREIDKLGARISARRMAAPQSDPVSASPIQTASEAHEAVERRKNLHVEKSMVRQRQPSNVKRLERLQADLQVVNAQLKDWQKQHPEWRPGG